MLLAKEELERPRTAAEVLDWVRSALGRFNTKQLKVAARLEEPTQAMQYGAFAGRLKTYLATTLHSDIRLKSGTAAVACRHTSPVATGTTPVRSMRWNACSHSTCPRMKPRRETSVNTSCPWPGSSKVPWSTDGLKLSDQVNVTKVAVDEDLLSLSAILLDDEYYAAIRGSKTAIDGVSIIDQDLLIPFKAKACLDLTRRKADGSKVDSRHIRKHRNDVLRLAQLLVSDKYVDVSDDIAADLRDFLNDVRYDENLDPKAFGVDPTRDEGIALLEAVYRL